MQNIKGNQFQFKISIDHKNFNITWLNITLPATYIWTPMDPLKKLTAIHLHEKVPKFYRTSMQITVLATGPPQVTIPSHINTLKTLPPYFFNFYFNVIIYVHIFNVTCVPSVLPTKTVCKFHIYQGILHVPPISLSFIYSAK
jgi:hypothetical protein